MVVKYLKFARENIVPWKGENPELVKVRSTSDIVWTDRHGNITKPPDFSVMPDPEDVLSGKVLPALDLIRFKSSETFVAGGLMEHLEMWEELFGQMEGFDQVKNWLKNGVDCTIIFCSIQR